MEEKENKKKRIRHPKKQEEDKESEQPKHFVLNVHNSEAPNLSKFGR